MAAELLTAPLGVVTAALVAGQPVPAESMAALAAVTDVLSLGALGDERRQALHGGRATFARVHELELAAIEQWSPCPDAVTEVRISGRPGSRAAAVAAVERARALAGSAVVRGFWLHDLAALDEGAAPDSIWTALRQAGLDEVAFAAVGEGASDHVAAARAAGLGVRVLAVDSAADRVLWLVAARRLVDAAGGFTAVAPLPRQLDRTTPTTGFDDVRTVALARLLLGDVPSIQVDWRRYGPKLAQVALTVGADDIDGVAASDDAALGPRRAAAEEVRRNIVAAGHDAVERDGRWAPIG